VSLCEEKIKLKEKMQKQPDFNRFLKAIRYEEPDHLPNAELWVDPPVKVAFLGEEIPENELDPRKPEYDVEKDIKFWHKAGYDYIRITPQYEFPKPWLNHPEAKLYSLEDYEKYPWPMEQDFDFSSIERAAQLLPDGMKVIGSAQGGIFEEAWLIMGYERFMEKIFEEPELIKRTCDSLGEALVKMFEKMASYEHVGALWVSDDIAYTEALILSPKMIRDLLLPWYEQMAAVAHRAGKPFIYHSDGDLTPLLEDFIAIGFDAIHPIEPKAMDIVELKSKVKGRLALIGSVDLDFPLSRGKPDDVRDYVKNRIREAAPGGGFAIGSSNSVTHYVPLENYRTMLETVEKFGAYPIHV